MKITILRGAFALYITIFLFGCADLFSESKPTVLTFWHVYGGQTNSPMNSLVERFNQTIGREKNITVNVTSLSNSTDVHFALVAASKKYPGAGELPDLFTTYPKTIFAIGPERLVDWKNYFSEQKLAEFVPAFLDEGKIDGRLTLLPLAKSSSALFVNATIFDQFSKETGINYESLATWEGMFQAAKRFHQWSGGKSFFKYDDWLHYSMLNTASLGGSLFEEKKINFSDSSFRQVWSKLATSAISGEVCLLDGYATTAMMTGEVLCGVESTASVLYFKDTVTFPDNTTIPLRLKILPVPFFKEGKPLAIQRGGGLGLIKSTKEKEKAAVIFAEWLTTEENNVPFVIQTGYFPVKKHSFTNFIERNNALLKDEKYREVYRAIEEIHTKYVYYVPPYFDSYGEVEKSLSDAQTKLFKQYRGKVSDLDLHSEAFHQKLLSELEMALGK